MAGYFFNDEYATPDAIDRRRALINALAKDNLSTAPVGHWTAALARVVGAGADQYETAKLNEADKKGSEKWTEQVVSALKSQLGGGGISPTAEPSAGAGAPASPPAPAAVPTPPMRPAGPPAGAPSWAGAMPTSLPTGSLDQSGSMPKAPAPVMAMAPSPGQPDDRDLAIRTIAAETSGKSPQETLGIAAVIANRLKTGKWGNSLGDVVLATNQFEPWNKPGNPNDPMRIDPNSLRYRDAAAALNAALQGQDPTGGATHFFAPAAQAALGRQAPEWGRSGGQQIGATAFFAPEGRVTGGAMPDAPAAGAQTAEQAMRRPAPGQFVNPMQGGGQGLNPQATALLAALSSPWAARNPVLSQVGQSVLSQQLAGNKLQYQTDGEGNIIALDPTGRRAPQVVYKAAVKPIPLGEGQRLVNPSTGQVLAGNEDSKITRDIATREAEIRRRGLDPNDPTSQRYILTGQLPDPEIKADERKMIAEAEDQKTELSGTIESLRRARELAPQAYSGFGAGIRGTLGANLPGPGVIFDENRAKATTELGKLVSMEAISAMSASLKGATTDTELKQFTNILADANASPELKIRTIDRMLRLAETKSATADERIKGIRSKTYFQPQRQQGAQPAPQGQGKQPETPTFEETKEIGGKKYGRRGNDWFEVR